ncbi:LOCUS_12650 [Haloferula helveola]|uniref:LOCUS_12650 n=1 Tax=Haloferula helveola TaxID=490095 RepID=A0ABM7RCD3_9BACT|nr:LOCUS_12650 [Haloferula helveola]
MPARRIATVDTAHQQIEVWKSSHACEFRVAGAIHAWWHRSQFLTGLAWDNLAAASLLRPAGPPRSLLMLGLAGGTTLRILRHLLPDCRFAAVDIDPEVVELARQHMHLDDTGVTVHIADAYEWFKRDRRRYDVIIDDCYLAGAEDVYRPQTRPGRDLDRLAKLLNPGGIFLTNLVTGSGHRRMQSRTRAAFKRRFANVRTVTTPESMNETLVGGDSVLPGGALDAWTERFRSQKDRKYWEILSVRKLK